MIFGLMLVRPMLRPPGGALPEQVAALPVSADGVEERTIVLAIERAALPFARPGRAPLTGREREQILVRLRGGGDFRFEAGRRIRFDRRGPVLRIGLVPARTAGGPIPGQ